MLATLTSKSQITLPKDIRLLLQLEPGDKIAFLPMPDGQITVSKANKASFSKLRGLLPQPQRPYTVEEMSQAAQDAVASKHKAGQKHAGT
ncbi:MAG: type II toxin-antitoxin system PrlF family antitoxin [Comamonadaceae bacterium]